MTVVSCPFTGSTKANLVATFTAPPSGETIFRDEYHRELWHFPASGHFVNRHDMAVDYTGEYVASTYQNIEGIKRRFDKVRALPPDKSDNVGRIKRIAAFMDPVTALDIGSGLGVFPAGMQDAGWDITALDPDPAACRHMESMGIPTICADFMEAKIGQKFGLVTINKVLEHVKGPVEMLAKAAAILTEQGLVYLEVPDGEMALTVGPERQEFFTEHWHAFSFMSVVLMIQQAGLIPVAVERLREPSGKFTLRAYCRSTNEMKA